MKNGSIYKESFIVPKAEAEDLNSEQKPWKTETRSHNSIDSNTKQVKDEGSYFIENAIRLLPNWSIAIGLNIDIPTPEIIRLGGEGHQAILQRCPDLDSQWENIMRLSAENFKSKARSLAYSTSGYHKVHFIILSFLLTNFQDLYRFILETKYGNNESARGCHLELSRSPTNVVANSTPSKLDLAGNDLNLIYDVWRDAVIKNWLDRYRENMTIIEAEVFLPASCAVYLVPGTARNPSDPKTLKWIPGETTDPHGKGMELIYQPKYKRKSEVGGDRSKCSWVSIKRVNGAQSNLQCQEMVCIFLGDGKSSRRSQFLSDLAKIHGAIHLFGRQPI